LTLKTLKYRHSGTHTLFLFNWPSFQDLLHGLSESPKDQLWYIVASFEFLHV